MPITLRTLLIVLAAVTVSLGVRAVLGRLLRPERVEQAEGPAGVAMEAMAGIYGLLAAFILGGAWDRFDQTRGAMLLEANAYADLHLIARALPQPTTEEFGNALQEYRENAIEELRSLARGRMSDEATRAVDRLWLILARFEPETTGQAELQSRAFDLTEELTKQRRPRLLATQNAPPPILWMILVGGAVAVLGVAALASVGGRIPAAYLALLTAVICLVLYSIYALSYPARSGLLAELAPELVRRLGAEPEQGTSQTWRRHRMRSRSPPDPTAAATHHDLSRGISTVAPSIRACPTTSGSRRRRRLHSHPRGARKLTRVVDQDCGVGQRGQAARKADGRRAIGLRRPNRFADGDRRFGERPRYPCLRGKTMAQWAGSPLSEPQHLPLAATSMDTKNARPSGRRAG